MYDGNGHKIYLQCSAGLQKSPPGVFVEKRTMEI